MGSSRGGRWAGPGTGRYGRRVLLDGTVVGVSSVPEPRPSVLRPTSPDQETGLPGPTVPEPGGSQRGKHFYSRLSHRQLLDCPRCTRWFISDPHSPVLSSDFVGPPSTFSVDTGGRTGDSVGVRLGGVCRTKGP